jgi:hypothetical protein
MQHVDFLISEWNYCLAQYQRLGYASYMARAMALEVKINALNANYESLAA